MQVSAMPESATTPDAERHWKVEKILMMEGGDRMRAVQYLEHIIQLNLDPNPVEIGVSALDLVSG